MRETGKINQSWVLVGAGNSHLQVIKMFGMKGPKDASLTLINETATMPYSGMIPGYLAGQYKLSDIEIDLVRLCEKAQVRFIHAKCAGLDRARQRVLLKNRPEVHYDLLSFNIGSTPFIPFDTSHLLRFCSVKPLFTLTARLTQLLNETQDINAPIAIVGGGASGCELAFALRHRLGSRTPIQMFIQGDRPLSGFAPSVSRKTAKALEAHGIELLLQSKIIGADSEQLKDVNGRSHSYRVCLWATQAAPVSVTQSLGLEMDTHGFIRVTAQLQTKSDAKIFATGDCIELENHPNLPKAGVFAVREGPLLWKNLLRAHTQRPLLNYHPQPLYLFLLNTGDGSAILSYGKLCASAKWVFQWKDHIDKKWMRNLRDFHKDSNPTSTQPADNIESMRCGGCGSKVPAYVINQTLSEIKFPTHSHILTKNNSPEDASIHTLPSGFDVQLQTVDFFKQFLSDPYVFGEIAANNALSDIFAMNGTPFTALAIVTLPEASEEIQRELLRQMLEGAAAVFAKHQCALVGGHTSESQEVGLGFSVLGHANRETLFSKTGLKPAQKLILTKPLGTGALLAAAMRGLLPAGDFHEAVQSMRLSNAKAQKIFSENGVRCCTDVTGFGLAGHLLEMISRKDISVALQPESIPKFAVFDSIYGQGIKSTLHEANARTVLQFESTPDPVFFDPQTSGGLLAAVSESLADSVLEALRKTHPQASIIGTIIEKEKFPLVLC